jgi:O-antigen/teichoic acid export membrane protein
VQIPGFWKDWHFSWHKTTVLVRSSAPIALIALIGILYQKISVYMVSTLDGPAPTGWFSAALRVMEASKVIHLAVLTALYPVMAHVSNMAPPAGEGGMQWKKPWQGDFKQSWKLLLAGAVAVSLVIFIFAGPIILRLYGPEYAPAVEGLRLLSFILIPFTANTFFSLAIFANRKEQTVMRVQLAGLATLIALNAWWIPRWGVAGACLAFVLAETLQALLYLLPGWSILQKGPPWWAFAARNHTGSRAEPGDGARTGDRRSGDRRSGDRLSGDSNEFSKLLE